MFPANAATGGSLADAVDQNQKDFIDREVLGAPDGGAAFGVVASPTGRLRTSDHDGLKPISDTRFSYETDEASLFANVAIAAPGTVLGGQLKFSGFVGYNWLSLDLKSNAVAVLDPNQSGSAENDSFIVGGTVLWALQDTYALATIVGAWGETRLVDSVDDCFPGGCNVNRYEFDTTGFIGTVTAGKVFDLAGASGPKLDLRGSVAYIDSNADPFTNICKAGPGPADDCGGVVQDYTFSTWTGTASVTLFMNMTVQGSALFRPYIQGYVRQEWDYSNEIEATFPGGAIDHGAVDQSHTYGGVDAGLAYTLDKMTVGGAIYYEGSADEDTFGGRIGASWTLN
jgi:outer membrane autotransporter protein